MDDLTQRFEEHRGHLRAVAYRMLGSLSEADDAVQESWLRLSRADVSAVENLRGWLTTVVGRICLDMLRSRTVRREDPLDVHMPDPVISPADSGDPGDPEQQALVADSIGLALLIVLDTLTPAERLAFVLHDMFAVPFEDIGRILGRSSAATKQLASRAPRRVRGSAPTPDANPARQRQVVDAFLAASRAGEACRATTSVAAVLEREPNRKPAAKGRAPRPPACEPDTFSASNERAAATAIR